jgi:amino acid transporter
MGKPVDVPGGHGLARSLTGSLVIFIAFVFFINLLGVRVFGELEFWFSSIKSALLLVMLLLPATHDDVFRQLWLS